MSRRLALRLALTLLCACSTSSATESTTDTARPDPAADAGSPDEPAPDAGASAVDAATQPDDDRTDGSVVRGTCGDGILTRDEACDDGNQAGEDGCSADCRQVAQGVTCPEPGEPCRPFARCGDGLVAFPEQCDDGARAGGDGCSASCKVELGWQCDAVGGAGSCRATVCGDGRIEGAETCDDGNGDPLDGCSARCVAEPHCQQGGCTSTCGDGIVLGANEACDDGNTLDGDGCSAACQVEQGYTCREDTACDKDASGRCVLRVPVVFRDFAYAHPDFESDCGGSAVTTGLVASALVDGKPVGTSGANCTENLADWYVDKPGLNVPFATEFVLYDDGAGGFVNRYGPNGERWVTRVGSSCSQPGVVCEYDGTPFFFPVDGIPGALDDGGATAAISTTEYGFGGSYYSELDATGQARLHNFAFTSEVTYWFRYDAGANARLLFTGDDDFWVFVNGRLALDLGGLHPALSGSVSLDAANASALGLTQGGVYEIKVFHAERHSEGSSLRLTLAGFSTGRSDCAALCGDGMLGVGEECDDGINDGGYNECAPGCSLGAYCGDGLVQPGEDCDDGNRVDDDDCPTSCRQIVIQ